MGKYTKKQIEFELRQLRVKMRMKDLMKYLFSDDDKFEIENYRHEN